MPEEPVLEARELSVTFPPRRGQGTARAVDGVNLALGRGEVLALIGESGCGKSTLARALVGLIEPNRGEIRYAGEPLQRTRAGFGSSADTCSSCSRTRTAPSTRGRTCTMPWPRGCGCTASGPA